MISSDKLIVSFVHNFVDRTDMIAVVSKIERRVLLFMDEFAEFGG